MSGETVLIHGASGSTGLAAVQIAKLIGATVIATGRRLEKLQEVQRHGADAVDAGLTGQDWIAEHQAATGEKVVSIADLIYSKQRCLVG